MKNSVMILLLSAMLVLASCTGGNTTNTGKASSFLGGTNGLILSFEEDQPPREVFDNNELPFDVSVRVANMGEEDVAPADVEVRLTGIRAEEFGVTPADLVKKPTDVLTRTYKDSEGNRVEGTIDYITYSGLSYIGTLAGNQEFTLRADACYKYKTKATSLICITRDILDTTYDKVCRVNEAKTVQNSGAPIQVSNFMESPRGKDKVQFSFDVNHMSNGNFFRAGSKCEYTTANERVVHVSVNTNLPGLKCTGLNDGTDTSGFVTLFGGSPRKVTCSQDAASTSDYEQVVNIEVTYDYLTSVETRMLVKHAVN